MKQLLAICVLALQLFGTASARTVTQSRIETNTKKSAAIALFIQQEHHADITQNIRLAHAALQQRHHRSSGADVGFNECVNASAVPTAKNPDSYTSPLYLPLIRLLLYPKHYFW